MVKIDHFSCSKSVRGYGTMTSQILKGLAALEPPKNGGKRVRSGSNVDLFAEKLSVICILYSKCYYIPIFLEASSTRTPKKWREMGPEWVKN